jgi:hypothetical protein
MPNPGALRFNTDSLKLELFDGNQWTEIVATSPEAQTGGTRGVFSGGENPNTNIIDYITISSTGNAIDFGDNSNIQHLQAGVSSRVRGCFGGGRTPVAINNIDYITISSTGNAQDFGDLTIARLACAEVSNSTRGIFATGSLGPANTNIIDYITIASTGDAKDFGDTGDTGGAAGCSSSTRGIIGQGTSIEFITISTLGNTAEFGTRTVGSSAAFSNSIRGVFGGAAPNVNTIEYITIATLGNSQDFGDLTVGGAEMKGTSSPTRGVFAGGNRPSPTRTSVIDYVTIMSTGNAIDFGDLTQARSGTGACSNGHGGL